MEKEDFRAVIKHFYLKKWTAAQIKAELDEVHGALHQRWSAESFERSCEWK